MECCVGTYDLYEQLALVVIVHLSEGVDGLAQGSITFGVARHPQVLKEQIASHTPSLSTAKQTTMGKSNPTRNCWKSEWPEMSFILHVSRWRSRRCYVVLFVSPGTVPVTLRVDEQNIQHRRCCMRVVLLGLPVDGVSMNEQQIIGQEYSFQQLCHRHLGSSLHWVVLRLVRYPCTEITPSLLGERSHVKSRYLTHPQRTSSSIYRDSSTMTYILSTLRQTVSSTAESWPRPKKDRYATPFEDSKTSRRKNIAAQSDVYHKLEPEPAKSIGSLEFEVRLRGHAFDRILKSWLIRKAHRTPPSYVLLQPVLRIFFKSPERATQSALHALFLPTPFKVPVQLTQVPDAMPEKGLKPGTLYRECAVATLQASVPEKLALSDPKASSSPKATEGNAGEEVLEIPGAGRDWKQLGSPETTASTRLVHRSGQLRDDILDPKLVSRLQNIAIMRNHAVAMNAEAQGHVLTSEMEQTQLDFLAFQNSRAPAAAANFTAALSYVPKFPLCASVVSNLRQIHDKPDEGHALKQQEMRLPSRSLFLRRCISWT
ncbi:uncharacterized protein LACBIDRAFT_329677 [Laccaria bicolor S238N-H82]|uniref:Predicted protein n=1 Tax=Laccaria bicolor (strain S238N-H82 / ATCC MYA-4686) TaxID=486041 RepID=B0DIT4_LACBS|nr:uncharacterized protein LACBIDRAFT_329677 [Laccaria bicolor S238N-H82]EDR05399.1 predicted protein [Laccaria bicolor S238N-H82]|eukprot:XP_001883957.1 predicted protein [Laccaria bicolor S238N-H82]